MKQISTFMSEISDEFKIVVVDAIRWVTVLTCHKILYVTLKCIDVMLWVKTFSIVVFNILEHYV